MGYAREDYEYEYEQDKPYEIRQLEKKLDNSQSLVIELYSELTSNEPIDLQAIQFYMSELAGQLNIRDEDFGRLTIERDSKIYQFAGV